MIRSLLFRWGAEARALISRWKKAESATETVAVALPMARDSDRMPAQCVGVSGIRVCRESGAAISGSGHAGPITLRAGRVRPAFPPGLWLYRGSDVRSEVEALLAGEGLDTAFEYEVPGVPEPLAENRTLGASVAQADSPSAFVRFSRERDVRFVGFVERRVPDAVEKTYAALDERLRLIAVLRMTYPMPPGVFYRLYRGVIFSPQQLGGREISCLLPECEQALALGGITPT